MPSAAPAPVRLEMGLDRQEFFRLLPAAAEGRTIRVDGERIALEEGGARQVIIRLGAERWRQLGPTLRIPALEVEIAFEGFDAPAARAFLERFHLHYQRGGG